MNTTTTATRRRAKTQSEIEALGMIKGALIALGHVLDMGDLELVAGVLAESPDPIGYARATIEKLARDQEGARLWDAMIAATERPRSGGLGR